MAPTPSSPLDIVNAFLAAMAIGDYDNALKFIGETCDYVNPPPLGAVRGPAAVRSILEPFFAPTLENQLVTIRALADGPVVMLERLDRHRLATGWVELPVTGVFEVHDGQITYWRDYFDAATILSVWPS